MNETPPISKRDRLRSIMARNQWRISIAAFFCFVAGVVLSNHIATGVRVEKVTLGDGTPALEFIPAGAEPHPIALLAHGAWVSKETLFWYGEALSEAGFVCYLADLPGHGESPRLFSYLETVHAIGDFARAVGPVDLFLGDSMGGATGGEAVREGLLHPKLVIALGSSPRLGDNPPPLLFLVGRFDEGVSPDDLKARTDGQLIVSPRSDHLLEPFDPLLIHSAVNAACASVGKPPPPASTAWRWHLAGFLLALLGAVGLKLGLPTFPPRGTWARGLVTSALLASAFFLTIGKYMGFKPHLQNVPLLLGTTLIALLVIVGLDKVRLGKLRFPRGMYVALACIMCAYALMRGPLPSFRGLPPIIMVFFVMVFALYLALAATIGALESFRGSRLSGHIAMAVVIGCGFFRWGNAPRMDPALFKPKPHLFVKLDAKLCDACAGHYEFAPDNVFRYGADVKIWRQGDQMFLQATGRRVLQGAHEIFPYSETNFLLKINGAELTFIKNEKGEVTGLIHHKEGSPDSRARRVN